MKIRFLWPMHIANDQTVAMLPSQFVYWKSVANCKYSFCGGLIIKQDLTVAVATTANKGMRRT